MKRFLPLLVLLAGCTSSGQPRPDSVPVTATVTRNGQPVKDVICSFVPQSADQLGDDYPLSETGHLKTGRMGEPKLVPGKYYVYFQPLEGRKNGEAQKFAAAFRAIPPKYTVLHTPVLEVTVDGKPLDIKLD